LDDGNRVQPAAPFAYVPEITFKNLNWMDHLAFERFPRLAGWNKNFAQIFAVLNDVAARILSEFDRDGTPCAPHGQYGQNGLGFGRGTVHHAAGSLRMPYRSHFGGPISAASVVDEDLRVRGTNHLYVCDMSVMSFSSAANPVRTLVALALRLSRHFGGG
jgi:choline dehydrogenase-like flavoprotein